MILRAAATLALLIGTSGCATSRPPFRFLAQERVEPPPVQVPAAECQETAPDRPTFLIPVLPPAPAEQTDPLSNLDVSQATRDLLLRSRDHWRARAEQAETISSASLEHIIEDNRIDQNLDDLVNRCASADQRYAAALADWASRNERQD